MAILHSKWSNKDWDLKQGRRRSINVLSIYYILDMILDILKFMFHGKMHMVVSEW